MNKKMKDLDEILKHALTPDEEPDFWLNQKILNHEKEREGMDKRKVRRIPAAALSAALILGCGSVTAFAAWKYLTPDQAAEKLGEKKIADAFLEGDAVQINETQSYGGYNVTLMGLISGEELSAYPMIENGEELISDRTYSVVAISNSDGTPMPEGSDDAYRELSFFVSPLIKDYNPREYNAVTMRGGFQEFSEDGILYRIAECDNVEIFADHGLYLCVNDGTFYEQQAYNFDEKTGEISRNKDYEGLNALFDLPIDASKADPEAAAEYLTSLQEDDDEDMDEGEDTEADQWMEGITEENIEEHAQRVEDSVQTSMPDEDGYISFDYEVEGRSSGSGTTLTALTKDHPFEIIGYSVTGDGRLEDLVIETIKLNEDGTVSFAAYIPKEG